MVDADLLLVGQPNCGKTLLFNRLTGLQQKVANYAGVTVKVNHGQWMNYKLADFPGSYSLNPLTDDERVAVETLKAELASEKKKVILCVLDSTRLQKSLLFGLQVKMLAAKSKKAILFVLNMCDELDSNHLSIDTDGLQKKLGAPCVLLSAKTKKGFSELQEQVHTCYEQNPDTDSTVFDPVKESHEMAAQFGPRGDVLIRRMNAIDNVVLSSIFGGVIFLFIMLLLFQSIFTWSAPLMDGVEGLIVLSGNFVSKYLSEGFFKDFMQDAVFGGLGSFLVFVPQIFVLTFIIGLMEDSGYLSRAAIICHRPFKWMGLSGKSFIPFLSGHACAIPAIYASRMIASPKKRLLTILTVPLISCSARLPVYSLLVAAVIPATSYLGGAITLQGITFFMLFVFGYIMAFIVSAVFSKTIYQKESDTPFIVELPPYRRPLLKPLFQRSLKSSWEFMSEAGPVIFAVTVAVWFLGYFPNGPQQLETSYLATLGRWIEPVFAPMGLDWRYGVAILSSFVAREVFVGTLGTFLGIEAADENIVGLAQHIDESGLTIASGLSLLVFYVIALQCASTLAVLRRETGSIKTPALLFVFYSVLAYVLAVITFNIF